MFRTDPKAGHEPLILPSPDIDALLLGGIAACGAGVALFDPDDTYVFGSPAFVALLDVQPGPQTYDSLLRHCHRTGRGIAIPDLDVEAWLRRAKLKRRSLPHRNYEKDLSDGRWLRITETTFNGGWVLHIMNDITDLKSNEATLRQARDAAVVAAKTDALTGLHNRASAEAQFTEAVAHARQANEALSISLVDLDHFKRINDGFGHDAGDKVLVDFARLGRATLRKTDVFGRIGGEEFIVIMPKTMKNDAVETVESLRGAVERSRPLPEDGFQYTMSAGVTAIESAEMAESLYKRADTLLYQAKNAGRNRIACDV